MSTKKRILIQLDTDTRPSSFDSIVAIDAGAEVLLPYSGIEPEHVRDIVYGGMFTRGVPDLQSTAVWVGGSDVAQGERVLAAVQESFFGPFSHSVMLDSSGANTTAAGAVVAALKHFDKNLEGVKATVLAATGPVGRRVARLLARCGAEVTVASRALDRAEQVQSDVQNAVEGAQLHAAATGDEAGLRGALQGANLVVAAGGPKVQLLPRSLRQELEDLRVAIDLNAVPPEGIEGIGVADAAVEQDGTTCYGAIGVGGIKMKIHKACVASLFESNDRVLDAEAILDIGRRLI